MNPPQWLVRTIFSLMIQNIHSLVDPPKRGGNTIKDHQIDQGTLKFLKFWDLMGEFAQLLESQRQLEFITPKKIQE